MKAIALFTPLGIGLKHHRALLALARTTRTTMSSSDEENFNSMEKRNWEQGFEAYDAGFGPLTSQTIPTLLSEAGYSPSNASATSDVRLLDVATGPGFVLSKAVDLAPSGSSTSTRIHLTGLDVTEKFIDMAKHRIEDQLKKESRLEADFVLGSAETLPFDDCVFTSVTCNFGILHFFKPREFLRESFRVLKPGGRLSFSCWAPPSQTEGFHIALTSISEGGNPNVEGLPAGPEFFDFGDADQSKDAMREIGFEDTRSVLLSDMAWNSVHSGEDLYSVLLEGTSRTREVLLKQTADETKNIKDLMARKYITVTDHGSRPLRMPALITSGRKPSEGLKSKS